MRKVLYLKSVAYDSMNQEMQEYLVPFLDEKTQLEVRSTQGEPTTWNTIFIKLSTKERF